ncbi:MAG TPA: response regulator [Terracidiphilus sp.]|jgi:CheY-like chemotaxis protein|nr:response regulator [Terracidiphilus sp.]
MIQPAHTKRVMIVDDEKLIADTLVLIFEQNGYEARSAYSAEEALQLIGEWHPDLAILDIILPQMNGVDLAILLKAEAPQCRVVLISGHVITDTLLHQAARDGHNFQVYPKPTPPADLLAKARDLLSESGPPPEPLPA